MDNTQPIFLLQDQPPPPGITSAELPLDMPELLSVKIAFLPGLGTLTELIPLARSLMETMLNSRIKELSAGSMQIACQKGCHAACCRYLISVSVPEALMMIAETAALSPDERKRIITSCKKTALHIQQQMAQGNITIGENVNRNDLLGWYRQINVPCPMLENNCCTIYDRRPIVCRECLAVGSPDQCKVNTEIQTHVRFPIHPANILVQLTQQLFSAGPNIIALPAVFDWFTENGHLYQKTFPRELLVKKFVEIALTR
jgi:Fe-S-cluster containining protein